MDMGTSSLRERLRTWIRGRLRNALDAWDDRYTRALASSCGAVRAPSARTAYAGFAVVSCLIVTLLLAVACQEFFGKGPMGALLIDVPEFRPPATRGGADVPDVATFRITVTGASGQTVYESEFARFPDELPVPAGTYTVSAVSAAFEAPAFEAPQWGDTQVVSVAEGSSVAVTLACRQLNSGLRLDVDESFREAFPDGKLSLKGPGGTLPYAYGERRAAFFLPGTVSLLLDDGGFVQTLFTRQLEACQILTLRLSANVGTRAGGVSVSVDTARTWLSDRFVVGGGGADSVDGAYDVAEARLHAGERGVWVWGYIVGVATNTRKVAFSPPFNKNTNLVLGTRASTTELDRCLSVELPAGAIREALNLQDHPGLLGRAIYIRGDLVAAYYGIPGLKDPSEYQFK